MRISSRSVLAAVLAGLLLPARGLAQAPTPEPTPDLTSAIRTPPAPNAPRINGPRIYGARPGHPFLYHVPVTGQRPMAITAEGLPEGLRLDAGTGDITGAVAGPGSHEVTLMATNAAGRDAAPLRIVISGTICLTPPLGWNDWNHFKMDIDDGKIRGAADAMVATGLIEHGWTYINIDDNWEGRRDAAGNIHPSARIPDMKGLVDYIHGKGLKAGIYSSPGPVTCGGAVASWRHEDQDAATYGAWGIDYLKYDLCSYRAIARLNADALVAGLLSPDKSKRLRSLSTEDQVLTMLKYGADGAGLPPTDEVRKAEAKFAGLSMDQILSRLKETSDEIAALDGEAGKQFPGQIASIEREVQRAPYLRMRAALDKVDRDIVFSFCQYGIASVWEWGAETGGNLWRTTHDIDDNWESVESQGFGQNGLEKWAGPGHWNDPDMLEIGNGGLTADESYTHMTLWCMLSAPLLIGCDLRGMDPFTISLFSNDEVLAIDQDALGRQGWRARQTGRQEVWMKPLADGSLAVAFFNRADTAADVGIQWADLKLAGPQTIRDLWRQRDLGVRAEGYSVRVARHGAELFKVAPEK